MSDALRAAGVSHEAVYPPCGIHSIISFRIMLDALAESGPGRRDPLPAARARRAGRMPAAGPERSELSAPDP